MELDRPVQSLMVIVPVSPGGTVIVEVRSSRMCDSVVVWVPNMLCERCNNCPQVVRITDGVGEVQRLCLACALDFIPTLLPDAKVNPLRFWMHLANPRAAVSPIDEDSLPADSTCGGCGLDYAEFARNGQAGCGQCYSAFASVIVPALRILHSGASAK